MVSRFKQSLLEWVLGIFMFIHICFFDFNLDSLLRAAHKFKTVHVHRFSDSTSLCIPTLSQAHFFLLDDFFRFPSRNHELR